LFEKIFTGTKNFNIMKKHFKAYVSGFDGAKELRVKLMSARDASAAAGFVEKYAPRRH